ERVERARAARERVLVFGDFDADGLSGLAILVRVFRVLGIDAAPYVPSRVDEGHGLSLGAVRAAVDAGRTLIVTVDCGTTSGPEIAAAAALGIDVLVTDHHHVPVEIPPALAVVNPHRPDSVYPDRRLTGSGVAFKVACLLLGERPEGARAALDLADLAAIGTVSDMAPIVGENRSIARLGLERLRSAPRPGIAALLAQAGVAALDIDLETIGFTLAPRLNAAGRVGEAGQAAALLLADDAEEAATLAAALEVANSTRRDVTRQALLEVRAALPVPMTSPAVVVRGPWPVGVVGLVAGRLAEELGRPVVVAAELDGVLRASCRSAGGLDLAAALDRCGDLFIRHGGHAGAAGFEVASEQWAAFEERFLALAADASIAARPRGLRLDLALPAGAVDYGLLGDLARLAPTGPGNPDPLVGVFGLTVQRIRAATGGHTQLTLRRDIDVLDAIAFERDDLVEALPEGSRVDVVARLASRRFGGFESLQLEIRDIASAGYHVVAGAPSIEGGSGGALGAGPIPIVLAAGSGDR
ncbi:MAG TPA: single-stranded-DNA-specific exonuclease RecJ, partial [Candidatus Limnocylindrales bacterium]